MHKAPTDTQAREYAAGYLEQHEDCDRFRIKSVGASPELNCKTVTAYVEWQNGDNVGNDTCRAEVMAFTVWLEDDGCGSTVVCGEW